MGRPNLAISVSKLASPVARDVLFGCLEKYFDRFRHLISGPEKCDESGHSRLPGKQQADQNPSPNRIVEGGASKFLTIKHIVEFFAALIAVIGGILALLQWLL